jgi:hypothetical protein
MRARVGALAAVPDRLDRFRHATQHRARANLHPATKHWLAGNQGLGSLPAAVPLFLLDPALDGPPPPAGNSCEISWRTSGRVAL